MKTIAKAVFLCFFAAGNFCGFAQLPEASVTIKVLDDEGTPVSEADIAVGYEYNTGSGVAYHMVDGRTGKDGTFTSSGKSSGHVGFKVNKLGYYQTIGQPFISSDTRAGKWNPYNPILSVLLKRIGNPIPMYARQSLETNIPKSDEAVGFDLVVSDWVAPHGKGRIADLLFNVDSRVVSWKDYDGKLRISFSHPLDGIVEIQASPKYGSALRLPRLAPENGYKPGVLLRRARISGRGGESDEITNTSREDQNYFIRVRTVLDEKGNIVRAQYGKIHGDFEFDPRGENGSAFLRFTYYLNPRENDRNVEFDPARNLVTDLKRTEKVSLP